MVNHTRKVRMRSSTVRAALAAMTASIFSVFCSSAANSDARTYIVAANQIVWGDGVDLSSIGCLTLNRRISNPIYKVDYSNDPAVLEILRQHFPGKTITSNNSSCPYVLTFVIMTSDTPAIRY